MAPAAAARLLEREWFRVPSSARSGAVPPRPDAAPSVRELLGSPFEVRVDERAVRGWSWGTGPVVYLVHGWGGTLEHLVPFVGPLLDAGLRPVALDGLGHGSSDEGRHGHGTSDAVELGRSLDAVAAHFGPARAVVAHSMGGLATLLALRDGWVGAERLVLVAPVPGVPWLLDRLRDELAPGEPTLRRLAARAERRTGYPVADLDLARLGTDLEHAGDRAAHGPAAGPGRPDLLVVHDLGDREVPHDASAALARTWPGARLLSTVGLGHRRILTDRAVTGAVARFAARLPVEDSLHGADAPAPWPFAAEGLDAATWSVTAAGDVA
ncbi:alpha/beta fold hydrolase [Intrasporangium sp. YIM S08009]|uniref:alpha/beta fold hydrolase n=1 Tax=Intrasporangium zincisolvens TaxID=3080018 RepID=UPI002B05A8DC|nr:alpha/beta fold hydrolase [Intrasporangium sp. YIM S08009]